ncbi:MAG: hypothetical protein PHU34_09370 [Candidatus Methanoperedens sp.]|nr:hypothetical protein [Candidatus Methanoperedens sp.]
MNEHKDSLDEIPFGLTFPELTVLMAAFEAGFFVPGSCSCRKPKKTIKNKDLVQQVGINPQKFSRLLRSACQKVIYSVIKSKFRDIWSQRERSEELKRLYKTSETPKKTMKLKDVAQQAGMSPSNFSHALSNARRKILYCALQPLFGTSEPKKDKGASMNIMKTN